MSSTPPPSSVGTPSLVSSRPALRKNCCSYITDFLQSCCTWIVQEKDHQNVTRWTGHLLVAAQGIRAEKEQRIALINRLKGEIQQLNAREDALMRLAFQPEAEQTASPLFLSMISPPGRQRLSRNPLPNLAPPPPERRPPFHLLPDQTEMEEAEIEEEVSVDQIEKQFWKCICGGIEGGPIRSEFRNHPEACLRVMGSLIRHYDAEIQADILANLSGEVKKLLEGPSTFQRHRKQV